MTNHELTNACQSAQDVGMWNQKFLSLYGKLTRLYTRLLNRPDLHVCFALRWLPHRKESENLETSIVSFIIIIFFLFSHSAAAPQSETSWDAPNRGTGLQTSLAFGHT